MSQINPNSNEEDELACFDVLRLATSRAAELSAFESSMNELTAKSITCLQRLPVRLRRRAASHRINRLPRRLHRHAVVSKQNSESKSKNFKETETVQSKLTRPKSRRFRRRHHRLMIQHARLASASLDPTKSAWLPTHLWHAKRFHMIDKWGWKLPQAPTNKIFKACQRASHSGCLLFDMSYLACFELSGPELQLKELLSSIFQPDLNSPRYVIPKTDLGTPCWAYEQTGLLYNLEKWCATDTNISRPILCPVRILWGSLNKPQTDIRQIWVWVHPCVQSNVLTQLTSEVAKLNTVNSGHQLTLNNQTGKVCRIRTIGRQSHGLLADMIRSNGSEQSDPWKLWDRIIRKTWQASCLPPGLTITLPDCLDFQKSRPRLKTKNRDWSKGSVLCEETADPVHSDMTTNNKTNNQLGWTDIGNFFASSNHPGPEFVFCSSIAELDPIVTTDTSTELSIDLILIQNATEATSTHCPETVGWDIVLMRSKPLDTEQMILRRTQITRDLLVSCVYRGSEVGGLRDLKVWASLGTRGNGRFDAYPDLLWPDTEAGKVSDRLAEQTKRKQFERRPPKLRLSYDHLETPHPFACPWTELITPYMNKMCVDDEQGASDDWFVLRDTALLRLVVHRMLVGDPRARLRLEQLILYDESLCRALILVYIENFRRGVPEPCAVLFTGQFDSMERNFSSTSQQRHILGYVQEGGYGFSVGHGIGLGFISLAALSKAITDPKLTNSEEPIKVFVKNPNSLYFQPVKLTVII